jgi:polyribonucleotide nucleotidyltransferase
MKALLERPEGMAEERFEPRGDRGDRPPRRDRNERDDRPRRDRSDRPSREAAPADGAADAGAEQNAPVPAVVAVAADEAPKQHE